MFFSKTEATNHILYITRCDTVQHTYCDTALYNIASDVHCRVCTSFVAHVDFGDGQSGDCSFDSAGNAYIAHNYSLPGHYTVQATTDIDSVSIGFSGAVGGISSYDTLVKSFDNSVSCHFLPIRIFYDSLGMDIYDAGFGRFSNCVVKVQVCLNGIPVDTISCSNGLSYYTVAGVGNIYSFKIISAPLGYSASGPSGGIVYDTISAYPDNPVKYLGLKCAGTSGFDLGLYTSNDFTRGAHQVSRIYTFNNSCNTENPSVTVQFSPKYVYAGEANPAPSLSSGNSLTWNLTGTDILHLPVTIFYKVEASPSLPLGHLIMGDTVQTYYTISPTTGDDDLSNNSEMVIDTVTSSYDPNEMSVTPSGYISSGTQLKYTINFENTGNDTAFNIHVMDTLSDNVDVKSLDLIMASAVMNIATFNQSGHNIVKFDFPNINLLDSTHHGLCDGAVIFTINTKTGLPNGTLIDNRAGIYFDYNPVVMTNQVENIIGIPSGVSTINASSKVELYPNPVSNELTIKTDNTAYNSATISNIMGQVMMTEEISTALTKVNVQRLPAGMYYITLRGESGVKVMKFEKM